MGSVKAMEDHETSGRPVRLLHVIGTISPEAGGPTEMVRSLVELGPPDYVSEVITLDPPEAAFLGKYRFPIHAVGPIRGVYGYTPHLEPWLRENWRRFDGVVVHGLWQYCGHAVRKVLHGKIPYIVFPHGMLDPYFKRRFPLKHLKKWLYWLGSEYWTLRGADRVLFTTDAEQELAKESFWLHRWRGMVVALGASEPDGDPAALRKAFVERCPGVTDRRFVLFLGRIHPKKGCDLLVRAFADVAAGAPELHLVMAGPDQQQWGVELRRMAADAGVADRVHWPGMLLGEAKWGALLASEVFALPSHQENFGIAVAEALGCGRAVLLSDKINIARTVAADGAGLMESDTEQGTRRLLERWLAMTGQEREAMGVRARACFRARYELKRNTRTILEVFGRVRTEQTAPQEDLPAASELIARP